MNGLPSSMESTLNVPLKILRGRETAPAQRRSKMNNTRRKELEAIKNRIEEALAELDNCKDELQSIQEAEQEYLDNMPENLQDGERAQAAQEAIDNIESAVSDLDGIDLTDAVDSIESAMN